MQQYAILYNKIYSNLNKCVITVDLKSSAIVY